MKRLSLLSICLLFCVSIFAQSLNDTKEVTRFLDIPIDGSEKEMFNAIKKKGFKKTKFGDSKALTGKFNDVDVIILLHTNNNKVYRVVVVDANSLGAYSIRNRYNYLCYQFENNMKYGTLGDQTIPEDENIATEMSKGKNYQAVFYQLPDTKLIEQRATEKANSWYNIDELNAMDESERRDKLTAAYASAKLELMSERPVWFTIVGGDYAEGYRIAIYYENEYNKNNGSDL